MTDDLLLLIRFVYFALEKEKHIYFEEQNITASQGDVLLFVGGSVLHNKQVNQRDIETHLRLTNPTVTGILTRLEEKEFIRRVKSETDGRNKLIQLTSKSEALLKQFMQYKSKIETIWLEGFSKEEREQFRALLAKGLCNLNGQQGKEK